MRKIIDRVILDRHAVPSVFSSENALYRRKSNSDRTSNSIKNSELESDLNEEARLQPSNINSKEAACIAHENKQLKIKLKAANRKIKNMQLASEKINVCILTFQHIVEMSSFLNIFVNVNIFC